MVGAVYSRKIHGFFIAICQDLDKETQTYIITLHLVRWLNPPKKPMKTARAAQAKIPRNLLNAKFYYKSD